MAGTTRNGFKDGNGPGNSAHKGEGKGDLTGTDFADHIMGTKGDDTSDGGLGNDVMIGFAGNDTLNGGGGNDDVNGGEGADTLTGGEGQDNLAGGEGDDVLVGGTTTTESGWVLTHDDADNTLDEWTFVGAAADDGAADHFIAAATFAGNGTDTIQGYGEGDVIDLTAALGSVVSADLFADGYLSYDAATGELSVDTDGSAGSADSLQVWFIVGGTTPTGDGTFTGETPPDNSMAAPEVVTLLIGAATVETPVVV